MFEGSLAHLKIAAVLIVALFTLLPAYFPFRKRSNTGHEFPVGEAFACGVFLGVALIHMLGNASSGFQAIGFTYPFAFVLCGFTFLILLFFEHVAGDVRHAGKTNTLAVLTWAVISIHAFLEGTALGLGNTFLAAMIILSAILAHKWAESFALAVQVHRASFVMSAKLILILSFALMTPLGIFVGNAILGAGATQPYLVPLFESLAAGTFLYMGTLHGLFPIIFDRDCCNSMEYALVVVGFLLMAVVAIWT